MWKKLGRFLFAFVCAVSLCYTGLSTALYIKNGPHPNRMDQYAELFKDGNLDVFMGPDGSLHVLNPEQVQKCNAGGGCIRVTYEMLETLMRNAYTQGEETKIGGHD